MLGFGLALSSALMYSFRGLASKKLLGRFDSITISAYSRLLSLIPLVAVMFIAGESFHMTLSIPVLISVLSIVVLGGIANIFSLKALHHMPLSIFNTVNKMGILFTALLSTLLLKEFPGFIESIGIILIVLLSMSLTSGDESIMSAIKKALLSSGFRYVAMSQLFFSLSSIGMKYWGGIDSTFVIVLVSTVGFSLTQVPLALAHGSRKISIKDIVSGDFILLAVISASAFVLNLLAKNYVSTVVFDVIISVQVFVSIITGHVFLKERYNRQTYLKLTTVVILLIGLIVV